MSGTRSSDWCGPSTGPDIARLARRIMRMTLPVAIAVVLLCSASPRAHADDLSPSPDGSYLYIIWPNDGEVIKRNRFRIFFGLRGMGVAPAGIELDETGHHHLLIDTPLPPSDEEIPADNRHIHFGAGQTEALVELPSGTHTLQLMLGDHNHIPHNPPVVSKKITITIR